MRNTIIFGLIALVIRYLSLVFANGSLQFPMILTAVLVHGVIFGYFYLGGQIFIDRKAPATLRAQGQGFIFFTTFGVGMLIGNFVNSEIIRFFSHNTGGKLVYQWENIFLTTTVLSFICLLSFMLLFKNEDYKALTDIK